MLRLVNNFVYNVRYFFGLGRHWTAGLLNYVPNPDDRDMQEAIETGRISIEDHQKRLTERSSRP